MTQPNILFILIDDLGWRDLSCYGSSFYETPNIDRLANEGMQFTNAHASCPVCSPTRASIHTGQYPARVGITQYIGGKAEGKLQDVPYLHYLPLEHKTIASALKEGGYQTWHVGKWHMGDEEFYPDKHGFDVNVAGNHHGMPAHGYFSPYKLDCLEDGPEGEYLTDRLTAEAIKLIENRDASQPFFLNLAHYTVHTPIQAPQDLIEKYEAKAKRLGLDKIDPFQIGDTFPCAHKSDQYIKRRMLQSDPAYAAMVETMDISVGRIMATLEAQGILDNTMIIFTSDNGGLSTAEGSPTCNHPLAEGKGWMTEGGTRVCQMVRFPSRVRAGAVSEAVTTSTDFYPTLLEAAGLDLIPEQHCDGISLWPALEENGELERDAIYWHYPHYGNQGDSPGASIHSGDWKLIQYFEDSTIELYNLRTDISEVNNLVDEKPNIAAKLKEKLHTWQQEIEAKIPQPNPNYPAVMKKPKVANNAHI